MTSERNHKDHEDFLIFIRLLRKVIADYISQAIWSLVGKEGGYCPSILLLLES